MLLPAIPSLLGACLSQSWHQRSRIDGSQVVRMQRQNTRHVSLEGERRNHPGGKRKMLQEHITVSIMEKTERVAVDTFLRGFCSGSEGARIVSWSQIGLPNINCLKLAKIRDEGSQ